jgi:hypothetical protein
MGQNERFPYAGAIDADGHILEPPDLWEKYIDPQYRDQAIRIHKNDEGLEVIEVGGAPAKYFKPGQLAQSGAMGKRGKDLCEPSAVRVDGSQRASRSYGSRGFGESRYLSQLGASVGS